MAIPIEAYTAEGTLTGAIDVPGRLRDVLEAGGDLRVGDVSEVGLDGRRAAAPSADIAPDALLLVVPAEVDVPHHAVWHPLILEVGPYLIEGELPTLPGFDPGRALARPTGTFVLLRDVDVRLVDDPERLLNRHDRLLVNRYEVLAVTAALMLGFFFPGARLEMIVSETADQAAPSVPVAPEGSTAIPVESAPVEENTPAT
jgi:hypothetical protein